MVRARNQESLFRVRRAWGRGDGRLAEQVVYET